MGPERVVYSALRDRPRLVWPNNARLALWIVPNIEFFEYLPGRPHTRDPWPRMPHPDIRGYSLRDYGPRVGFWRMIETFDEYNIRATMSLNVASYAHFPALRDACEARGYDAMSHGIYNTEYISELSPAEERADIRRTQELFETHSGGRKLTGWYSAAGAPSLRTPDILAEAGIEYFVDWMYDDQPFPMNVKSGQLISMPYSMDPNDGRNFREPFIEAADFIASIKDQFDRLYRESEETGLVMTLALHPYVMGQPHRIGYLKKLFDYIFSHEGVWQATGVEITRWFVDTHLDKLNAHLAEVADRRGAA
ncbi:MAG: polysaccharide deacetylase family protein [Chelatococcus sp.]|uniref:polysaccharide deacetylase family protein n=1 Tax=Chelatococcus sp. TaxID=1953771 RepID=UPI0025C02460|nr:polysaccharide deacetylase family protein [Chelatococcus sp.]MBX3539471.1 polysaccharide deacetylase family protein [Chelatococcus sp.]